MHRSLARPRPGSSEAATSGSGGPPAQKNPRASGLSLHTCWGHGCVRLVPGTAVGGHLCFHKPWSVCLSILPGMWLHTVLLAPSLANTRPLHCIHLAEFGCIMNNVLERWMTPTHSLSLAWFSVCTRGSWAAASSALVAFRSRACAQGRGSQGKVSSTLADRALDETQVLPLIRKGLGRGWEHHEVLHRGSWHWHLGSAPCALHQLPWGGSLHASVSPQRGWEHAGRWLQ